jgi:hypothetical protein
LILLELTVILHIRALREFLPNPEATKFCLKLIFFVYDSDGEKQHNLPLQGAQTESEMWIYFEYVLGRMRVEETSER